MEGFVDNRIVGQTRSHEVALGYLALGIIRAATARGWLGGGSRKTRWVNFVVKLLRAYGGCLGASRR